jgi:hypothetical protein
MPRSIVLRPPGGASGKLRQRYALIQKLMLLDESESLWRERDFSLRRSAQVLGLNFQTLARWRKEVPKIRAAYKAQRQARNRKALLDGPAGILGSIEMELLQFVFAKREQGINVRHMLVAFKASALLCDTFGPKSFNARLKAVGRFMQKLNYVYHRATHEATHALAEVSEEAKEFIEETRPLLEGPHRDRRFIFNMDQTPLLFSYESLRTLEKRGKKTIFVHKSSNSTKRSTAALTVTAAGDFLTPMVIFKGTPTGLISRREPPQFDPTLIYGCQDSVWMDEGTMIRWVDEVFAAYIAANPPPEGMIPVLLLDSYRCHMMALVVSRIMALGVEVIHIPGG